MPDYNMSWMLQDCRLHREYQKYRRREIERDFHTPPGLSEAYQKLKKSGFKKEKALEVLAYTRLLNLPIDTSSEVIKTTLKSLSPERRREFDARLNTNMNRIDWELFPRKR